MKIFINTALILSIVYSSGLLSNEHFYKKYNQPKDARGSQADFIKLWVSGECHKCNLKDFDLSEAIKRHTSKKINLSKANCSDTRFHGANLDEANLSEAKFDHANLENTNLNWVNAQKASFKHANFSNVNLRYGNFDYTNFKNAKLENVDASGASFKYAKMQNANMLNAVFNFATFAKAILCLKNHAYISDNDINRNNHMVKINYTCSPFE